MTLVASNSLEVDVDGFPGAGGLSLAAESLLSETTVSVTVSAKSLEALFSSVVARLDARSKSSLSASASWACSLFPVLALPVNEKMFDRSPLHR